MFWDIVNTPTKVLEYVNFEKRNFGEEQSLMPEEYMNIIQKHTLTIHVFRDMKRKIIGSFQIFWIEDKLHMSGFAIEKAHRGTVITDTVMRKLIHDYGKDTINCKTEPKYLPMRKLLERHGWENKIDEFEDGKLWSHWEYNKGNDFLRRKVKDTELKLD